MVLDRINRSVVVVAAGLVTIIMFIIMANIAPELFSNLGDFNDGLTGNASAVNSTVGAKIVSLSSGFFTALVFVLFVVLIALPGLMMLGKGK